MRLNRYVAASSHLSRRAADTAIAAGRVSVNGEPGQLGMLVATGDRINLDSQRLKLPEQFEYLRFHKPSGYVTSRARQGSAPTIYELIPHQYNHLQSIGRLDKDSSGLLLLTNDGTWAQSLSHPSYDKRKVYELSLGRSVTASDLSRLEAGVELEDGPSRLEITSHHGTDLTVVLTEGRNRQLRRTFEALGHKVRRLHRISIGPYQLGDLASGATASFEPEQLT